MEKIMFVCEFPKCQVVEECEVGFFARLEHQHKDADGNSVDWYPVKIVGVKE